MKALHFIPLLLLGASLCCAPAFAVEQKARGDKPAADRKAAAPDKKAPAKETEQPSQRPGEPPYESQMLRLAEIMGSLSYLRDLCGSGDGAEYRSRMAALLDAEGKIPERREKLAGAYNRGYRGYETTYRQCTPNARTAITRFLAEGGRVARDISYHFGGT